MKSLERRFNNITRLNPYWSSYICFAEAIRGQRFTKETISRWFLKLVEKEDYDKKDKSSILKHLSNLSNIAEDNKN